MLLINKRTLKVFKKQQSKLIFFHHDRPKAKSIYLCKSNSFKECEIA